MYLSCFHSSNITRVNDIVLTVLSCRTKQSHARVLVLVWYRSFTATLQFVNVALVKNGEVALGKYSLPYIENRRTLDGFAEIHTCFVWEKSRFPDISEQ